MESSLQNGYWRENLPEVLTFRTAVLIFIGKNPFAGGRIDVYAEEKEGKIIEGEIITFDNMAKCFDDKLVHTTDLEVAAGFDTLANAIRKGQLKTVKPVKGILPDNSTQILTEELRAFCIRYGNVPAILQNPSLTAGMGKTLRTSRHGKSKEFVENAAKKLANANPTWRKSDVVREGFIHREIKDAIKRSGYTGKNITTSTLKGWIAKHMKNNRPGRR